MKRLRIYFSDFWGKDFNFEDNYFTKLLGQKYEVMLDPIDPEILIFSVYGFEFLKYKRARRVCFIAENLRPNYFDADYSISFDYDTYKDKNLRLPLYIIYGYENLLLSKPEPEKIAASKTKFCNMLISNPRAKERIEFFKILSEYKKVDSGGRVLNNIGIQVRDRLKFVKDYRFTIAFENSSYYGYTTEKIFQPMKVQSIPIYWGSGSASVEFNPKSFINVHDYKNLKDAAEAVMKIEENRDLYLEMLAQPWFIDNKLNEYFDDQRVLQFFDKILASPTPGILKKTLWNAGALLHVNVKRIKAKLYKKHYCHIQ